MADEAPAAPGPDEPLFCSFCNRTQHEVASLVAGPAVFICDECVAVCVDILNHRAVEKMAKKPLDLGAEPASKTGLCRICSSATKLGYGVFADEIGFLCPKCLERIGAALNLESPPRR